MKISKPKFYSLVCFAIVALIVIVAIFWKILPSVVAQHEQSELDNIYKTDNGVNPVGFIKLAAMLQSEIRTTMAGSDDGYSGIAGYINLIAHSQDLSVPPDSFASIDNGKMFSIKFMRVPKEACIFIWGDRLNDFVSVKINNVGVSGSKQFAAQNCKDINVVEFISN